MVCSSASLKFDHNMILLDSLIEVTRLDFHDYSVKQKITRTDLCFILACIESHQLYVEIEQDISIKKVTHDGYYNHHTINWVSVRKTQFFCLFAFAVLNNSIIHGMTNRMMRTKKIMIRLIGVWFLYLPIRPWRKKVLPKDSCETKDVTKNI